MLARHAVDRGLPLGAYRCIDPEPVARVGKFVGKRKINLLLRWIFDSCALYRTAILNNSDAALNRRHREKRGRAHCQCRVETSLFGSICPRNFVGWSPTKAGQRILAESLARELGPDGIHVAYIVVDALIDMPFARRGFPDKPKDFFAQPADLAEAVFHTTNGRSI